MTCPTCSVLLEKYHDLVKELLAMKRDGFSPTPPSGEPPIERVLPEGIKSVLSQMDLDVPTYRHLVKEAWSRLDLGQSQEEVMAAIETGETVEW